VVGFKGGSRDRERYQRGSLKVRKIWRRGINMRKRLTLIVSIVLSFALLVGCGNNSGNTSSNSGSKNADKSSNESAPIETPSSTAPQEIRVGADAWMVEKLKINEAAKKFEASHDNVKVIVKPYADKSILANFSLQWSQGKTDYDVVLTDGMQNAVQFLAKDLIIDYNDTNFFEGATAKENFVGEVLSFGEVDGFQFALPISLETYAINVNRAMFEKAGYIDAQGNIIQPQSWEELYEYAKKMTITEGGKVVQQGMTIQWGPNASSLMLAAKRSIDGTYLTDGILSYDTPAMREILKIWKKGADEGVFSIDTFTDKDAGRNNYKAGQVAMLYQSGSHAAESAPLIGADNVDVIPAPNAAVNGSYAFAAGVLVPRASEVQDLAVQFIKEALMDKEIQVAAGQEWGKLPVLEANFDEIDAQWKDKLFEIIKVSVPTPYYKEYPIIDKNMPILLQNYLSGKLDLDTFIKDVEKMIAGVDKEVFKK